jgi:hypothetical protein
MIASWEDKIRWLLTCKIRFTYGSPALAYASTRVLRNAAFSSSEMSHSDSHLETSDWESWRVSRSSFATARFKMVV